MQKILDKKAEEFISFQIKRKIINLSKFNLIILEDLLKDNCISEEFFNRKRAQLLSFSNDSIRELQEYFENWQYF